MKISKILAGVSAMAVAASMAISASAATTITINEPVSDSWASCFPKVDGSDDWVDAKSFTKDTAMDVVVNFEWTEAGLNQKYAQCKPARFGDSWKDLYTAGFMTNVSELDKDCTAVTDGNGIGYTTTDGQLLKYAIKNDGCFITNDTTCTQMTFTITAEGVNSMIEKASATNGFDGIIIQVDGLQITSIEFSQDGVKMASAANGGSTGTTTTDGTGSTGSGSTGTGSTGTGSTGTGSTGTGSTGTGSTGTGSTGSTSTGTGSTGTGSSTSATDNSTATGATAGLALAGIALAGAAFVISKKK